jgi:capsular polysaccharide biosynthesis protein
VELKHYFKIIQKRLWIIAIIVIIACVGSAIKSYYYSTPVYQASAKLIVNQTIKTDGASQVNLSLVQTNIMLINSYKEIIKSAAIMNKVSPQYQELGIDPRVLAAKIVVSSASDSQVMDLVYRDTTYQRAAKAVNAISTVFKEEISHIMKVDNVTILNEADPDSPMGSISANPALNIVISFAVSLVLAIGIVFLLDYLDNTFKSEVELEEELGLPLLAVVTKIRKADRSNETHSRNHKVGESHYATINQ